MFGDLQFPLSSGILVLPVLTGSILAIWSHIFVRNADPAGRAPMFMGLLVPATITGLVAASAAVWNAPRYDVAGYPPETLRAIQLSLFLAFVASLATIPAAAKMTPVLLLAASRLRRRQVSLALLVASAGLAGPLVVFLHTVIHSPGVLVYVGLQYAIFGFVLWQFTRPALEEAMEHND